jgi:hypothetical protein
MAATIVQPSTSAHFAESTSKKHRNTRQHSRFLFLKENKMGWSFGWNSRKELVDYITKSWVSDGVERKCIAKSSNGPHVLWTVWQVGDDDLFIGCHLTKSYKGDWGYKGMSESMGPAYYGCPLRFLDMVPIPDTSYAEDWRKKVIEYHAQRNKMPKVGETWTLPGSTLEHVFIVSVRPLVGVYLGTRYRIPRKMLGEVVK